MNCTRRRLCEGFGNVRRPRKCREGFGNVRRPCTGRVVRREGFGNVRRPCTGRVVRREGFGNVHRPRKYREGFGKCSDYTDSVDCNESSYDLCAWWADKCHTL